MSHSASGYHDSSRASGAPGRSHTISLPQSLRSSIDAISNRSASTGSPTSSGGSHSLVDKSNSGGAPATPSRRQQGICDVSSFQQRVRQTVTAHNIAIGLLTQYRLSMASLLSEAARRLPVEALCSIHSLHQPMGVCRLTTISRAVLHRSWIQLRLSQVQALSGLQGTQTRQRGDSNATQPAQPSPRLSGRGSFGSSLRSTTFQHSSHDLNANYMTGVPEPLARSGGSIPVKASMTFRVLRDIVPSSPFAQQFDAIWAESYKLGKAFGAAPIEHRGTPVLPHENYIWPVFINPYTGEPRESQRLC